MRTKTLTIENTPVVEPEVGQVVTVLCDHYAYNQSEPKLLVRGERVTIDSIDTDDRIYVERANGDIQRTSVDCVR